MNSMYMNNLADTLRLKGELDQADGSSPKFIKIKFCGNGNLFQPRYGL